MKTPESIPVFGDKEATETKEKKVYEEKFHFKEIAEIEPAATYLVEQLKEKIEKGEYDALISDDAGGRIPTLLLRDVMKEIAPDKKIETLFVASGKCYYPKDDKERQQLLDYLRQFREKNNISKALLVTQFIWKGSTIARLLGALEDSGIKADVAALEVRFRDEIMQKIGNTKLYEGSPTTRFTKHEISEEHENLSGVGKRHPYSPVPSKLQKKVFTYSDLQEIYKKHYGEDFKLSRNYFERTKEPEIKEELERISNEPITPKDAKEMQENINLARKDIKLLSKKIVQQVWRQ